MKKEGWSAPFINQRIDEYIESIPTRDEFVYKRKYKEFKAGDLKKDKVEEEKERNKFKENNENNSTIKSIKDYQISIKKQILKLLRK